MTLKTTRVNGQPASVKEYVGTPDEEAINAFYESAAREFCRGLNIDPDDVVKKQVRQAVIGPPAFVSIARWKLQVPELHRAELLRIALENTVEDRIRFREQQEGAA